MINRFTFPASPARLTAAGPPAGRVSAGRRFVGSASGRARAEALTLPPANLLATPTALKYATESQRPARLFGLKPW